MELEKILIRKKDATLEEYNSDKIAAAINKSALRCNEPLSEDEVIMVISLIEKKLIFRSDNIVPVISMHSMVEQALDEVRPDVAKSYRDFRNWKVNNDKEFQSVWEECQTIQFLGDKTNANADSCLVSTKRVKKLSALSRKQYEKYFLTQQEKQAVYDGYIYIHDRDSRYDTMNCCLFDIKNVLTGGFEMSNVWYNEPKSIKTAFSVIGDITLMAASQQYGGFTLPEVDEVLAPYAEKSYQAYVKELEDLQMQLGISITEEMRNIIYDEATRRVRRDIYQGFQGWEYKFNTVASSRGDYPFISISFGLSTSKWGRMISIAALNVRKEGQGKEGHKKPVLFPKLIFLYDENLHGIGKELEEVFEAGVSCSAKTMYPDYLSLTGKGYVSDIYKKYGLAISPMGCRAFLSPWYKKGGINPVDENDTPVFIGRFNIGAISLHLPMILAKARQESRDFYEVLDFYLNMIRGIHIRTYQYLGQLNASMNPLAFCEGGFLGGNLSLDEKIEPLLKSATASFGITALEELQHLYNGKSLREDGQFSLDVLKYINDKVSEFKKEDGRLYAIYGTPAESLCGLQIKQFRKLYGIIPGVSDRVYVSNSFHCHVTEDISPVEKQDLESRFWDLCNGGKIQYVRYSLNYNNDAIRSLVRRAMDIGFYEGVNLSLAYCDDCGHEELDMDTCPKCGSKNLTKIDRMNGYLSYSRVHGDTRLNAAKMAEIAERKSM